jgi:hypothetical protein
MVGAGQNEEREKQNTASTVRKSWSTPVVIVSALLKGAGQYSAFASDDIGPTYQHS